MDIGFVYSPPSHSAPNDPPGHPSHLGFQDVVGGETHRLAQASNWVVNGTILEDLSIAWNSEFTDQDVYVLESVNALYAAPSIQRAHPEATVIFLAAHGFFGMGMYRFEDDLPKHWLRRLDRRLHVEIVRKLMDQVDGILAVSEYVAEYLKSRCSTPVATVYPYIQSEMYEQVSALDLDGSARISKRVITVCEARDHKGVDLLVEAWPMIRETHPDAELHIIGEGHPETYERAAGVRVRGFVENLVTEYERADAYVHPARQDAFGVTVVEAMLAGCIPIVTRTTGAREEVAHVDEQLITTPTSEALATAVSDALAEPVDQQRAWRKTSRECARNYTENDKKSAFVNQFNNLIESVRHGEVR